MKGLIPDTLLRLKNKRFTPNMEYQIMQEENERSFIEWCRREERVGYDGLPSRHRVEEEKKSLLRMVLNELHAAKP